MYGLGLAREILGCNFLQHVADAHRAVGYFGLGRPSDVFPLSDNLFVFFHLLAKTLDGAVFFCQL